MKWEESANGWVLSFENGTIDMFEVDFRLGLLIGERRGFTRLTIETPFRVSIPGVDVVIDPELHALPAPMPALYGAQVRGVSIERTGRLRVDIAPATTLEVQPHPSYEAWQLYLESGGFLVCMPGGEVAQFDPPQPNATMVRRRPR